MSSENDVKVALEMLQHEGNLVWSRFSVFLVGNSIVIAALVLLISNSHFQLLSKYLTSAGIALCICWLILTVHGFFRCKHYRGEVGEHDVLGIMLGPLWPAVYHRVL